MSAMLTWAICSGGSYCPSCVSWQMQLGVLVCTLWKFNYYIKRIHDILFLMFKKLYNVESLMDVNCCLSFAPFKRFVTTLLHSIFELCKKNVVHNFYPFLEREITTGKYHFHLHLLLPPSPLHFLGSFLSPWQEHVILRWIATDRNNDNTWKQQYKLRPEMLMCCWTMNTCKYISGVVKW